MPQPEDFPNDISTFPISVTAAREIAGLLNRLVGSASVAEDLEGKGASRYAKQLRDWANYAERKAREGKP